MLARALWRTCRWKVSGLLGSRRFRKAALISGGIAALLAILFFLADLVGWNPMMDCLRDHRPLPALKTPGVLVEKSIRRLTVLDGGKRVKRYRVVVGTNAGDKEQEGDRRTPEGDFYICYKNPQSRFTLSMGLSYPSVEDAQRGLRQGLISQEQHDQIVKAISEGGVPPWYTPLGGEIMIHGGGSNRTGTAGCVGMDDGDVRELYNALEIGTPVTIRP